VKKFRLFFKNSELTPLQWAIYKACFSRPRRSGDKKAG